MFNATTRAKLIGTPVNSKPKRVGYRPVMSAARDGLQVAFPAYASGKLQPSRPIESMCGVGTAPSATPPPLNVMSFEPMSSAKITMMFGFRFSIVSAGPCSHTTGWLAAGLARRIVATSSRMPCRPPISMNPAVARAATSRHRSPNFRTTLVCLLSAIGNAPRTLGGANLNADLQERRRLAGPGAQVFAGRAAT